MELTPELTSFSVLMIGFFLGLRHATDADHLAAVSTIVSEKRGLFSAIIVGGFWGIGHTLALLLVGLLVIFLKLQISASFESKLEAVVGLMLVALGTNALRKIARTKKIHIHSHQHDGREHSHVHVHRDESGEEATHHRFSPRSVLIGMVHGLAGSAALMLLIIPSIHSNAVALAYILVFGLGSVGGMMLMSAVISVPFYLTVGRFNFLNKGMRLTSGLLSTGLGLFIIYQFLFSGLTA
jgi:high-affinity nickel permease